MKEFQDKVVWITGASSGIGRQMAKRLNSEGAFVILSSRRKEVLQTVQEQLSQPEKSYILTLDVEKSDSFKEKTAEVFAKFGRIDFLFNNAGVSQRAYTRDTDLEVDRRLMEINYFGTIALTKAVLPVMLAQKSGHIVVVSSVAGKFGFYLRSAYSASKFALHGFFESLRLEEEENGIDVTIFCPGPVNTNVSKNALDGSGISTGQQDEMQENGMSVEDCVEVMIDAVRKNRKEVVIGEGPEKMGVLIKNILPGFFHKLLVKRKPRPAK